MYRGFEETHTYVHTLFYIYLSDEHPATTHRVLNYQMPVAKSVLMANKSIMFTFQNDGSFL